MFKNHPMAAIRLPSEEEITAYMDSFTERHPNLGREKVWCTIDGLKLYLQAVPNQTIQERFYNGWMYDNYVTNIMKLREIALK